MICYKINLFHGEYTEAAIAMYYKFERIKSSYLNFSEILGKKTVKEFDLSSKVENFKLATA